MFVTTTSEVPSADFVGSFVSVSPPVPPGSAGTVIAEGVKLYDHDTKSARAKHGERRKARQTVSGWERQRYMGGSYPFREKDSTGGGDLSSIERSLGLHAGRQTPTQS